VISKLLTKISKKYFNSEDGQSSLLKYKEMTKHPGWAVHQGFILEIANSISTFMLSKEFTELDKESKDAQQRAFYMSKEIVEFLLDPQKGAIRLANLQKINREQPTGKRPDRSK